MVLLDKHRVMKPPEAVAQVGENRDEKSYQRLIGDSQERKTLKIPSALLANRLVKTDLQIPQGFRREEPPFATVHTKLITVSHDFIKTLLNQLKLSVLF